MTSLSNTTSNSGRVCQAMKQRADENIKNEVTLDNQGRFYLPTYAAMYLITNERQYADKAKQWLDLLSKNTIQDSWTCLEYIPVAAIALREKISKYPFKYMSDVMESKNPYKK